MNTNAVCHSQKKNLPFSCQPQQNNRRQRNEAPIKINVRMTSCQCGVVTWSIHKMTSHGRTVTMALPDRELGVVGGWSGMRGKDLQVCCLFVCIFVPLNGWMSVYRCLVLRQVLATLNGLHTKVRGQVHHVPFFTLCWIESICMSPSTLLSPRWGLLLVFFLSQCFFLHR